MKHVRLWILAVALAGCGGSSGVQGSCDQRASSGYCQDYVMVPATDPYKSICTGSGSRDVWSDGACPRTDSVGGCRDISGAVIKWFYRGGSYPDAAAVMAFCKGSNGSYVAP